MEGVELGMAHCFRGIAYKMQKIEENLYDVFFLLFELGYPVEKLRAFESPIGFFIRLVQVRYGLICSHAFKVAFCRYYVLYMHFVDLMDSLHLANKLGQELSKQARADLELPPEEMKSIR